MTFSSAEDKDDEKAFIALWGISAIHNTALLEDSSSRVGFHQAPDDIHIPLIFHIILSRGFHDAWQVS